MRAHVRTHTHTHTHTHTLSACIHCDNTSGQKHIWPIRCSTKIGWMNEFLIYKSFRILSREGVSFILVPPVPVPGSTKHLLNEYKWKLLSHVQPFASPWNPLGQSTRVGSLSLLQGIFPIQELNQGLLHCRQILYQLSYQGSSVEWIN